MSNTKSLAYPKFKLKIEKCEFHFDVNGRAFFTQWERLAKGSEHFYIVNIFRGGGYQVSYPVRISPNQSNSAVILTQFLRENPTMIPE